MTAEKKALTRQQIRAVFRRHRGAALQLANELGVKPVNISNILRGVGRSERVEQAVRERAEELLRQENE